MPQLSVNWAEAVDPVMNHWFELGVAMRPSLIDRLFNVQTSTNSDEKVGGIGGLSVDAWESYEKSGRISEVDFDKGFIKTYTHKEYPLDVTIQRKLADDLKYQQIGQIAMRLGASAAQKRELDAASVFNNAFSASYVGGDAVALCSDSHPMSPDNAAVQDNYFTLALSATNLTTVRTAMLGFTDDKGNPGVVTPNLLLVPPELEKTAYELTNSALDPATGNNAANILSNQFTYLVWPMLTDANAWFVIDSALMRMHLDWFNRVPLAINRKVQDETLVATYRAYMRYSFGWSDYRWIAGSNPS